MKEIYDWVPWFRELVRRIADEGEAYLNEKAAKVDWGENLAQLEYGDEGIDPFSFLYFLASKAATTQLKTVYESVSEEFGIESPLPDPSVYENYIFPTPEARYRVFCEMSDASHELLWRLFSDVARDEPTIDPIDFENALKLSGVGVTRLTQTLFLINPGYFQPVDNITDGLSGALGLPAPSAIETELRKEGGYVKYRALLKRLTEAFPGCQPYELNMLFYFLKTKSKYRIEMTDQFYQVSTHAFGDDKPDYWEGRVDSFKENNWGLCGRPKGPTSISLGESDARRRDSRQDREKDRQSDWNRLQE